MPQEKEIQQQLEIPRGLAELVCEWLSKEGPLTHILAEYRGRPGIFYQTVPDDTPEAWFMGRQYPRIVYSIDMQADQERRSAGTMTMELFCDEAGVRPQEVEPLVQSSLKTIILCPGSGAPCGFARSRTDGFEISRQENGADTRVLGRKIQYDILEYPNQETTDPDPVTALNCYIKELFPEACVLWKDPVTEFLLPGADAPVFYCRLDTAEKVQETNTAVWMDCRIAVHILCTEEEIRRKLVMSLANRLSLDGEVVLLDKSPMRVKQLQASYAADAQKTGQLAVTGRYGLLRYREQGRRLCHMNIDYR